MKSAFGHREKMGEPRDSDGSALAKSRVENSFRLDSRKRTLNRLPSPHQQTTHHTPTIQPPTTHCYPTAVVVCCCCCCPLSLSPGTVHETVRMTSKKSPTRTPRIAVIGAGPSGIAAAKNVLEAGLGEGLVVFEKNGAIGGNWVYQEQQQDGGDTNGHSSVNETTYSISSRYLSEYEDFPFPRDTADYPHRSVLCRYFQDYAEHFKVTDKVRFHTEVVHAERDDQGKWQLQIRDQTNGSKRKVTKETFDVLMVANGHHWDPRFPTLPGKFAGDLIHSHSFKHNRSKLFQNKRVLVIGGGNSACDVAVECSRVAEKTCLSMRRGHWIVPKFIFGLPCDVINASLEWIPTPTFLKELFFQLLVWIFVGSYKRLGLQTPDYDILQGHITLNSELFYFLQHGAIETRTGIERIDGKTVHFINGGKDEFDTIVCATGYKISFPFFDESFIDWKDAHYVPLWRRMFHPDVPNLYFIGLFQPLGCIWPLADYSAELSCQEILGKYQRPMDLHAAIEKERKNRHSQYIEAPRHSTEVDYLTFRSELLSELRKCGIQPRRKNAASALIVDRTPV